MGNLSLPLTGGCLCGAVRFEVAQAPISVMYCHCTMCRRWSSGTTTITAKFPETAVTYVKGGPRVHKSSERGRRGFCENCGSHLSFQYLVTDPGTGVDVLQPELLYIPVGAFDNAEELPPDYHYCIEGKLPWLNIVDDLPRRGHGVV